MPNPMQFFEYGYNENFEPEYEAVLSYAVSNGITTPGKNQNYKNDKKIKELKALGVWGELDLFYYFKQHSGLSEFCKINWVDPSNYFLTQTTPSKVPVFEPNKGFKGTAANLTFFETGYIPSTDAVNALLSDTSVFFKTYEEISGCVMGTRNGSGNNFAVRKTDFSGSDFTQIQTSTVSGGLTKFTDNSHILHTKNGTLHNYYVNGTFDSSITYASTSLSSFQLTLFAWNLAGTVDRFFSGGIEYFALGSGVFNTIPSQLYTVMNF